MAYQRKQNKGESPKLDMTPMIDVVFQLLIFFVVTLKQDDIFSKLNAQRPSPNPDTSVRDKQDDLLNIVIGPQGFVFNGMPVRLDQLDERIKRVSRLSKTAMVLIKSTGDAPHRYLVQALDVCAKHGMTNLSILSI